MKAILFVPWVSLLQTSSIAAPQTAISNMEKLSLEQAEQLVNAGKTKLHQDMAAGAIKSKRLDLIKMCIENQFTRRKLAHPLMELEDEDFRDEIVIMILRNETGFWSDDSERYTGGLGTVNMMNEPIIAAIRRNLPDFPLEEATIDDNPVSTRADRLKLAGKIETAISIRKGTISAPTLERPEKRPAQTPSRENPGDSKRTGSRKQVGKPEAPHTNSGWQLLAATSILLLTGIFLWVWRNKRITTASRSKSGSSGR